MSDPKRILIIDDDPDIRNALSAVVESGGFTALTATNSAEGMAAIENLEPDLVLCDMMMETVDAGMRAAAQIHSAHPQLPVYLLSNIGQAMAASGDLASMGFRGIFQKPVDPNNLICTIKTTLGV